MCDDSKHDFFNGDMLCVSVWCNRSLKGFLRFLRLFRIKTFGRRRRIGYLDDKWLEDLTLALTDGMCITMRFLRKSLGTHKQMTEGAKAFRMSVLFVFTQPFNRKMQQLALFTFGLPLVEMSQCALHRLLAASVTLASKHLNMTLHAHIPGTWLRYWYSCKKTLFKWLHYPDQRFS